MTEKQDTPRNKVSKLFSQAADLPDGAKGATTESRREAAKAVGYTSHDLERSPDDALLGIGCGNPVALASLVAGQTVLDLGSGAGFDAFLAADKVGPRGKVIGVDMNDKMISRARSIAEERAIENVEFRKGFIEALPLTDESVDVAISNCVINLSEDKPTVYKEIMRVLKPGGRLCVSDLVTSAPMPPWFLEIICKVLGFEHWLIAKESYLRMIEATGFSKIKVTHEHTGEFLLNCRDPACDEIFSAVPNENRAEIPSLAHSIRSIKVMAWKR